MWVSEGVDGGLPMENKPSKDIPGTRGRDLKVFKSFFTKKLERKLEERAIEIPYSYIVLMDTPFEQFSEEDKIIYDTQFRALSYIFVELLSEVYESMGSNRQGWEDMADRLKPTPIKVLAKLVLTELDRLDQLEEEPPPVEQQPGKVKIQVKKYGATSPSEKKERWWEKKIF